MSDSFMRRLGMKLGRIAATRGIGWPAGDRLAPWEVERNVRLRLPKDFRDEYVESPPQRTEELILSHYDRALTPLGFERCSPIRWVRRRFAPVCHVFEIRTYGRYAKQKTPAFGLSFDFVPHIGAGKIRWHRTVASARMDLDFDTQILGFGVSPHSSERRIEAGMNQVLPLVMEQATAFWDRMTSVSDWPEAEREHREWFLRIAPNRDYETFLVKPSPVHAFCWGMLGEVEKAEGLLQDWINLEIQASETRIDADVPEKLRKLLADVIELGGTNTRDKTVSST